MNCLINIFLVFLLLSLLGCSAKGPTSHELLKAMADLDRTYVPAYLFVDLGRERESELSLARLEKKWKQFYKKYYGLEFRYGVDIVDKFWKEDFDKIDRLIGSAEAYAEDKNLAAARDKLGEVRLVLKDFRHRNGLEYFLDPLNDFYFTLEDILAYIKEKDGLSDRDLEKLRDLAIDARKEWNAVGSAEIEAEVFGFDSEKVEVIRERIKEEKAVLRRFEEMLWSGDENEIFQTAEEIKLNFVVLYKAFGDFNPVFEQIKKEKVF